MKKGCLIAGAIVVFLSGIALVGLAVAAVMFGWIKLPGTSAPVRPANNRPITPPVQPTATPIQAPMPATAATVPDEATARQMVNATMQTLTSAIESGDFTLLYRQLSDHRKQNDPTTAEKLKGEWSAYLDGKFDLRPIFSVQPVFQPAPALDANGALLLKGKYPAVSDSYNYNFEIWYHAQGTGWAVSYISATGDPIEQTLASVPAGLLFVSSLENIPAALRSNFVPFSFSYPSGYTMVAPSQDTFVRMTKNETTSFAVHPATFPAGPEKEATYTSELSTISAALRKSLPKYEEVGRYSETVSGVRSRTLLWRAKTSGLEVYGRCYMLRKPNEKNGVVIAIVGTSLDPELRSAADVGVKGELGEMVRSFQLR
jgi:hypothetical protein